MTALFVLQLPGLEPMSANDRGHWTTREEGRRAWRYAGKVAATVARVPRMERCRVTLHGVPPVHRRRDPSNLMPTQKAVLDGMVDAGIVDDDDAAHVEERIPVIHDPTGNKLHRAMGVWHFWVVVEDLTPPHRKEVTGG